MLNFKNGFAPAGIIALVAAGAIVLLGGITVGVMKLSQKTEDPCVGAACPSATSTAAFPEPDWAPKTQCGDNVCNPNEKANPLACPQDCAIVKEVPKPVIESFKATPSSVISGNPVTLSWSSTSSFCASSGAESSWFATGGAANGSVETRPLSATRTFVLSCMAEDGATITKSVTVLVAPPSKPIVTPQKIPAITYFAAEPVSVVTGKTTKLSWTTKDVSSCTASGGDASWAGKRPSDGSYTTPALTQKQVYALACTGNNRTTTQKVTVAVTAVPAGPSITFSILPPSITSGSSVTIAWMSSSAASCTAGGSGASWGWTGAIRTSGTQTTPALKESQMYSITCVGKDGGTTTKSASVSVTAPKATLSLIPATQTVAYGKTASLRWTSSGVTSCTGSGLWADGGSFGLSDTKFTQALTAPAILEITCTGEGGSVTQKATVNVGEATGCYLGGTINHGEPVTAYQSSSVAYDKECVSEVRTCANGKLSGSYAYAICTKAEGDRCTLGGASYKTSQAVAEAYKSDTTTYPDDCKSSSNFIANMTCKDGNWTDSSGNAVSEYKYSSCTNGAPRSCSVPYSLGGGTVNHGGSFSPVYISSNDGTCTPYTLTCSNGTFGGPYGTPESYAYSRTCVKSCSVKGGSVKINDGIENYCVNPDDGSEKYYVKCEDGYLKTKIVDTDGTCTSYDKLLKRECQGGDGKLGLYAFGQAKNLPPRVSSSICNYIMGSEVCTPGTYPSNLIDVSSIINPTDVYGIAGYDTYGRHMCTHEF